MHRGELRREANSLESKRVIRLAIVVGAGFGAALAMWQLASGATVGIALLWGIGALGAVLILGGASILGIRLQRHDLPRPD